MINQFPNALKETVRIKVKCPKCSNILFEAFTLEGDIGLCLICQYKTPKPVKTKEFKN